MRLIILLIMVFIFNNAFASDVIRFGVFAYLGEEETKKKYEPIIEYINKNSHKQVFLEVLSQDEINDKISNQELDIVTTNPTHFLYIRQKYNLSGPIATLVEYCGDNQKSELGGVIFVDAKSNIYNLEDIKYKTIVLPTKKHMGGFQSQAFEFYSQDLDLFDNTFNLIELNLPHQDIIKYVLEEKADVGFIRDGILELMSQNNELDLNKIRVINKKTNNHPFVVSTALYPEWPLFALPHTSKDDVKNIISILFSINSNVKDNNNLPHGYTLPADYLSVEQLVRTLRLEPFDKTDIRLKDIWDNHYFGIIIIFVVLIIGLIYHLIQRKKNIFIESLLSNIGEGIYSVDEDGKCNWINNKALEILNCNDTKQAKTDCTVSNTNFCLKEFNNIKFTLSDRKIRTSEEVLITSCGKKIPVIATVAPINRNQGAIIVFRDITKQKEYIAQIEQTKKELIAYKSKLDLTLESSKIGIWEWDVANNKIYWDKNCYKMLGYDADAFTIDYEIWQSLIHPDDKLKADESAKQQLSIQDNFIIEFRYKTVENKWLWVEGKGKVIVKDDNGVPVKIIGSHTDITHMKNYEEILTEEVYQKTKALDLLNEQLAIKVQEEVNKNIEKDKLLQQQTRLALIGEIMTNVAHQWRQPLSAITVAISGLKIKSEYGLLDSNDIVDANASIIKNAEFLSKTIDNFRDFFKTDQIKKKFYIIDSIKDTIKIVKASYDNAFIEIQEDLDESLYYFGSDNLLSQVILNILSNSKDALLQKEYEHKVVSIKLIKKDKQIVITIKDNAGGILENIKDKIFDPYFTTKHQAQGTGLGLYISSQIISTSFNGKIIVDNCDDENGYGACFTIQFPYEITKDQQTL